MPSYTDYKATVDKVQKILVKDILYELVSADFEAETGMKPHQVLPDRTTTDEVYQFEYEGLSADLYPHERRIYNPEYNGKAITDTTMSSTPEHFLGIGDLFYEAWDDLIGDPNPHPSSPRNGIPMDSDAIEDTLTELRNQKELIMADPTLDDFIALLGDKNYRFAGNLLNIDTTDLLTPGGGHELSSLFMNGDIHVVYRDEDLAVLKPEYRHDLRQQIMNQRLPGFQRVTFRGEIPEPGFIVGRDDTPMGLFAHIIDATRLDYDQNVSRSYIHDVMGFDRNITDDEIILELDPGERVRLQGDLAVECLERHDPLDRPPERGNLPIDNHLVMLKNAFLPEGETRDQEPIEVVVPERNPLNINHDEHEPVAIGIMPGRYRFYLLPRGLQPENERPNWPDAE